ncbi:MAG TPA: hypothetical protein P5123_12835 [Spirochaetota bacterium]|nr:hypothetical protein [Spirochaetota bacterium]
MKILRHILFSLLLLTATQCRTVETLSQPPYESIFSTNRKFDILTSATKGNYRLVLGEAAGYLKDYKFYFAGTSIDSGRLRAIVGSSSEDNLTTVIRDNIKQPVDTYDFLLFLDDLIYHYRGGKLRNKRVWITSGRARRAGILLHPDDVFENRPRNYGENSKTLDIDRPKRPDNLRPANDGDLLGANWSARYKNASTSQKRLIELERKNPDFTKRTRLLLNQLEKQGALVAVHSAYRKRERGYLMWGAFLLSRSKSKKETERIISELEKVNLNNKLNVRIVWMDPKGWQQTVKRAKEMADAYDVVYATKHGALKSDHYDSKAVDITATGLPARLKLVSPSGVKKIFDLSGENQSRDLNLTPEIIDWVEKNFYFKKLRSDYPHWSDEKKI